MLSAHIYLLISTANYQVKIVYFHSCSVLQQHNWFTHYAGKLAAPAQTFHSSFQACANAAGKSSVV